MFGSFSRVLFLSAVSFHISLVVSMLQRVIQGVAISGIKVRSGGRESSFPRHLT